MAVSAKSSLPAPTLSADSPGDRLRSASRDQVRVIHTLGPQGTNLAAAAALWLASHGHEPRIRLHATVEEAAASMPRSPSQALLTCAVYPRLHELVFQHRAWLEFIDCFIAPTLPMVLASRDGGMPERVASHPAPLGLVPTGCATVLATSNAQAAIDCATGAAEGCITTLRAMEQNGLRLVRDFGTVPMVFTLHGMVPE